MMFLLENLSQLTTLILFVLMENNENDKLMINILKHNPEIKAVVLQFYEFISIQPIDRTCPLHVEDNLSMK